MRFFFYGTLRDGDVRRVVLRERAPALSESAVLEGWRRLTLAGVHYPVIVPAVGGEVDGIVVRGLDPVALVRLGDYEGPDYVLDQIEVRLGVTQHRLAVRVFVPRPGLRVIGRPGWDLGRWQRQVKPRFLARLRVAPNARAAARPASFNGPG